MRRIPGPVVRRLIPLIAWIAAGPSIGRAADHLLITEFAARPTDGEFVEIYNPTADVVVLSDYYLSDYVLASEAESNYWRVVDGALIPNPSFPNDFLAHFPEGTTIAPGQTLVVSLHDDPGFSDIWSSGSNIAVPDFELVDDGSGDGVPGMVDPGPELIGAPYIQSRAGLSNNREVVVLFFWDGTSDLVQDVDIVQWGNAGPDFNTLSPNKTGVRVDGPDPDTLATEYLADTAPQGQDLASTATGAHDFGRTVSRVDFGEGSETPEGGNGITGNDETSENYSSTWAANTLPSIGSPGEFGPPALVSARAVAEDSVEVAFSRALDPVTAEDVSNYTLLQIQTPGGEITTFPLPLHGARLNSGGRTVRLVTDPLTPLAFYEMRAAGILTEDLSSSLVSGSRAFFRGFNPGPGVDLQVPKRAFVPHLDGLMEIRYVAPQGESILLRVFDVEGREVFVMAEETVPDGGLRTLRWDGRDHLRQRLPAGLYILHLEVPATGEETSVPIVVAAAPEGVVR